MEDLIRNNIYRVKKDIGGGDRLFNKDDQYIFWIEEFVPYDFCTLFVFVRPPKPDRRDWSKKGSFDIPPSDSTIFCRFSHNQDGSKGYNSETFSFLDQVVNRLGDNVNLPPRMPARF